MKKKKFIITELYYKDGTPVLDRNANNVILCDGSYIDFLYGDWDKNINQCIVKRKYIKDK